MNLQEAGYRWVKYPGVEDEEEREAGRVSRKDLAQWPYKLGGSSDGDLKPERRASGRPFPGLVEVGAWGRQSARLQSILVFPPQC